MRSYTIFITPRAIAEVKELPGNVRQRVKKAIEGLKNEPRPDRSKALNLEGAEGELRRLRLDRWRILYRVDEDERIIDVFAVRKRPPYDYGDLEALLEQFGE